MGEDHLLTSEEVMNILQISRQTFGRRVKSGVLKPVNPEAKRHYRFKKSDEAVEVMKSIKDDIMKVVLNIRQKPLKQPLSVNSKMRKN
jgi:predicted site-specific integrase-resolvase